MPQSGDEKRKSADAESSAQAAGKKRRGRPFPKGVSGNPGGRSKTLAAIREEHMKDVPSVLKALLLTALSKRDTAVGVAAAKEFLDRVTGKAPQPIVGEDGAPPINIEAPALVEALRRYVEHEDDET